MSNKRRKSGKGGHMPSGFRKIAAVLALIGALAAGYGSYQGLYPSPFAAARQVESLEELPEYDGHPYVIVNENVPSFSDEDKNGPAYEYYSELDVLGRCGFCGGKNQPGAYADGGERRYRIDKTFRMADGEVRQH